MTYDVVIIGAGAAGMTAAIFAARGGASVCIIEHRSEPGKKLLQTGNGKCNLTHEGVCAADYRPGDVTFTLFLEKILKRFGYGETIDFFDSIGIPVRSRGGYIYPYSGTALSVRNALWDEMKRLKVLILTETEADVRGGESPGEKRFCINAKTVKKKDGVEEESRLEIFTDKLILATGLCAAPKTGSDGSGMRLAEALGVRLNPVLPSLVKVKCAGDVCRVASGVRHLAKVRVITDGKEAAADAGEVQFTDDGISGIPVFNVSGTVSEALNGGRRVSAVLDLFPDKTEDECLELVRKNAGRMGERRLGSFFGGMLPVKLLTAVARTLDISPDRRVGETEERKLDAIVRRCKAWELVISQTGGFEQAQVCRGGIDIEDMDPETLQIKKIPGLFAAGELADIDGPCGGYNLQWAWSSGAIAGGLPQQHRHAFGASQSVDGG